MATCDPNEVIQACWACRSPQELQAAMVGLLCNISTNGTGGGSVTSVALEAPSFFTVTGSPVVGAGTLTFALNGNDVDLGAAKLYNFSGSVSTDTGTSYTTQASDNGKIKEFNNGASIAVTLHKTAPVGFNMVGVQMGAGQVTYAAEAGGSLRNRSSQTKIAGQYGVTSLYVRTNAGGSAAEWVLSGDTGA